MSIDWLKNQWRNSLAFMIWTDLTPFGRATIWIPCWLICWAVMPVILLAFALSYLPWPDFNSWSDKFYHAFFKEGR